MLIISPQLRIPLREFQFTFARSGGPGGQNVNKVSSKATLRWRRAPEPQPPGAGADAAAGKDRPAIDGHGRSVGYQPAVPRCGPQRGRLPGKAPRVVAEAAKPVRRRRPTRPTRGSVQRRLDTKRQRSRAEERRRPGTPWDG